MQKESAEVKQKSGPTGNRRNPHTHKAIIEATLSLLNTVHYHALTIEAVAAEAGVGKATVYRWWPSKGALVAEAISSTFTVTDPPDTGDLRADLLSAASISVHSYSSNPGGILITALATDLVADPDLLESFIANFIRPRRTMLHKLLQRAIDEGLIAPGIDPELIMDMWAGSVVYRRLLAQRPVDDDFAAQLVNAFLVDKRTAEKKKPTPSSRSGARSRSGSASSGSTPARQSGTGSAASARKPRSASANRRNSSGDSRRK